MASQKGNEGQKPENRRRIRKDGKPDKRAENQLQPGMPEAQFRPGESGNPGGRPKGVFRKAYLRVLERAIPNDKDGRTYADAIAERIVADAAKGKIDALRELADRVDGKPTQPIGGEGGGPIPVEVRSPAEINLRLSELLAKASRGAKVPNGKGSRT